MFQWNSCKLYLQALLILGYFGTIMQFVWSFEFSWNNDNNWLYNSSLFGLNAALSADEPAAVIPLVAVAVLVAAFDIICATDPVSLHINLFWFLFGN